MASAGRPAYRPSALFAFLLLLLVLSPVGLPAQRAELPESASDHPVISPYEGSEMIAYEAADYDRLELPAADEEGEVRQKAVEGEVTRLLYAAPEGLSALQVHRNYRIALRDAGFEMMDECVGGQDACHDYFSDLDAIQDQTEAFMGEDHCYFLARHPGADGDLYVAGHTARHTHYGELERRPVTALQIVKEKPMATGEVQASLDAAAMARELDEAGRVRIYGIHFATDEAVIEPESEVTLSEIGTLLERHSALRVAVVGHTDITGSLEHNMKLSLRRAHAVVDYLTSEEGISPDRLAAHGVAYLAPVAPNRTEEGRARNRRVELVELR